MPARVASAAVVFPSGTTNAATNITATGATLNGTVNALSYTIESCDFLYGPTTGYGSVVPCSTLPGTGTTNVSATVSDLSPLATYHFELEFVYLTATGGMSAEVPGGDQSFTTLPNPPTVTTEAASGVSQTTATVNATVNPNGGTTTCEFQWGTSTTYGNTVNCAPSPGSGTSAVAVSAALSGLSSDTTYHYRVVATNSGGPSDGTDRTFATSTNPPTVTAVSPTSGPSGGGTVVDITGTNLAGATAVEFGSTPAASYTVDTDDLIAAVSPAGSGTVDVTVTTPFGTSPANAGDTFAYTAGPSGSVGVAGFSVSPAVVASAPTVQGSSGAAFSALVDPEGSVTTAYFEYGIDPSDRGPGSSAELYDETTPVQQVGADSSNHPVSATVAGLAPNALYHVRLVATNGAGTTVGPDQTFTTASDPAPPPPVLGKEVNVTPVSGHVFILLPPGKSFGPDGDSALLSKGQGFVPLTEARQIPTGSEIDALQGTLKMVTANGVGKTQTATLAGGVFTVSQDRTGITKGLADFKLTEGAFQGGPGYGLCKAKKSSDEAGVASLSTKTLQLLKVSGHGKFKTTGRYSSATVRGTIWTIADRCDGTLTHAIRDTVLVDDFVRHTTILLHSGQSYLARAIVSRK
ncbi:MAG TPA: IPT/TIG domain-containing protein [Solirubrobacteraceae bacterium]|nr:IPT/TIG domain-containing protein [Solirubrobacteraceae bacterium]